MYSHGVILHLPVFLPFLPPFLLPSLPPSFPLLRSLCPSSLFPSLPPFFSSSLPPFSVPSLPLLVSFPVSSLPPSLLPFSLHLFQHKWAQTSHTPSWAPSQAPRDGQDCGWSKQLWAGSASGPPSPRPSPAFGLVWFLLFYFTAVRLLASHLGTESGWTGVVEGPQPVLSTGSRGTPLDHRRGPG